MEDFEDLVVLRGNTEVISLNVLMAFTAYGQNFCQFTANGHYLTIAVTRRFFLGLTFFLQLTLKIFNSYAKRLNIFAFLQPIVSSFGTLE